MAKKGKQRNYRLKNKKTGEFYPVKMSRDAHDKLKKAGTKFKKFSKKLRKHVDFELTKEVGH